LFPDSILNNENGQARYYSAPESSAPTSTASPTNARVLNSTPRPPPTVTTGDEPPVLVSIQLTFHLAVGGEVIK
jgi:hypothetical protein